MGRNKIFLAMSLLMASTTLVEATDRFHTHNADGSVEKSSESSKLGGWLRMFMWHQDQMSSPSQGPTSPSALPTAEADSATTAVDTPTTIDLLANDTGNGLEIRSLYANTQAGGTTANSDGVVTYTPPAGFTGTDEFWYVVSDAEGNTIAAQAIIEVGGAGESPNQDATNEFEGTPNFGEDTEIAVGMSTADVACDYSEDAFNESVATNSTSAWTCSESERVLTANGIPDHVVGTFPSEANPNTITEQTISASFPLMPTQASAMSTPDVVGYVLNGVKIDAVTSGSCNMAGDDCSLTDNSGNWSIEALGQTSFDFGSDENNGYVQADGSYTYHGMPEGFLKNQGASDAVMTLIGWAADGFPIYGRHGHSDANDAASTLKVMTGSYQQVENTDDTRPSIDTYALGTFTQDWQYVADSGDLDECNGRTGVTPEFPDGIYHYFATESYPYFQRCVKGEIEGAAVDPDANPFDDTVQPPAVDPDENPLDDSVQPPAVDPDVNPFDDSVQPPAVDPDVNPFDDSVQTPAVDPDANPFDDAVQTPAVDPDANPFDDSVQPPTVDSDENPFAGTVQASAVDSTETTAQVATKGSWLEMFSNRDN